MIRILQALPLVALVLYVVSYGVLLDPVCFVSSPLQLSGPATTVFMRDPQYRLKDPLVNKIFKPMVWIDQKVRPNYWGWTEPMPTVHSSADWQGL